MIVIRRRPGTIGFVKTFDHQYVTVVWAQELYNYYIEGFEPGSFHRALFENNLALAALRTHPGNEWGEITNFMRWLWYQAPPSTWGTYDKVEKWLRISNDERFERLHDLGWVMTPEEITFNTVAGNDV